MDISQNTIDIIEEYFDEVRTDYSGRGMYGSECIAIVIDGHGGAWGAAMTIAEARDDFADEKGEVWETLNYMAEHQPSQDSMGLGSVVYWPHLRLHSPEYEPVAN